MDQKAMRRSCRALVRDLGISAPSEPHEVIAALCRRMKQRLGREVRHRLVAFPPGTVSGLWVATDRVDYILCEERTSPWHQLLITGHEFWHMEAEHRAALADDTDTSSLACPALDPSSVMRIVAARSHYDAAAEEEADYFASLLLARLTRWLPDRPRGAPDLDPCVTRRLESSLGGGCFGHRHV